MTQDRSSKWAKKPWKIRPDIYKKIVGWYLKNQIKKFEKQFYKENIQNKTRSSITYNNEALPGVWGHRDKWAFNSGETGKQWPNFEGTWE